MSTASFQKTQIEREVEEHKQKLLRSEQSLQVSQTKEQDLRKKMEELQREKNSVTVQLDQSSRRVSQLEEEKKGADQSFKRTQGLLDDLKAKSEGQADELKRLQTKLEQQTQNSARDLEHLKKTLSDAETKND
ncbi:autophagy-related protein 16-like, partial [Notothenia coriiceps]|uniref:Autophagy-related protein 16-like n=1 Tax=Notothenia coriiceps TaxID=8208 RepID=A0A6I9P4K0_9TELE